MTTVGGNLENKTIGLQFGVSGTFVDCELVNGKVQLKSTGADSAGNNIYAETGTWTSEIIDIGDNFADYGKLFASETTQGSSSIALETRTSDDGITFDEWKVVAYDGAIISTKRKFIQVRVTFYVAYDDVNLYISQGNNADDAKNVFNNEFIDTSNGITLKRDYEFDMTKDVSWLDNGELHKKTISRDDWQKINKVNILPSEKLSKTLILSNNEYKKWNEGSPFRVQQISMNLTSNDGHPIYKATASSYNIQNSREPYKSFDGIINQGWWTSDTQNLGEWIQIDLGENKKIVKLDIHQSAYGNDMPKAIIVKTSNDGVIFNAVQTLNITPDIQTAYKKFEFNLSSVIDSRYIRFEVSVLSNSKATSVGEIILYESIESTDSHWSVVSSTLPTQEQFLTEGMDSLSPLLDRGVQTLEPLKMLSKSEILLNNEGKIFSETLDLKKYMDIRKVSPSSTNGKMVFKNTTDNKYYIESNGSMVEVTDISLANILLVGNSTITVPTDFYNVFGDEVEVLFYTDDDTVTEADLVLEANWSPIDELDGNFEIVTWTDETDSTRTLEMSAIPKPQLIRKSTVGDIGGTLNGIIASTTSPNVRFLLTNNNSTWYKWNGTNFENVTFAKVDDILSLGNTQDELANADYSKWTHSKINIGAFLKDDDTTTSKVNELGIITNSPINTSQVSDLNFYILNTTAKIELDLKGLWLSGQLSDLDLTRVQYRVFLNEQPYHPLSGQFTNLDNPPLNIDITFKSEEVKINDWNTLRVEFKDSFGTVDYWQTTFVGNYSSLMFTDTDGKYYSDDVGKVLQYLDFGTFFGGQYSVEHEVIIKNQYGYDVENVMIEASTGHLPEGVEVQFSDTKEPFIPQVNLLLPNELKHEEEVSFYIRMISDIDSVPNGENKFNIFVKAERKV